MNEANAKILRKVGDAEAFYFCRSLGNFTGQKANSLEEFLQKIKGIDAESLEFHLSREDFEKWIRITIDDAQLAGEIGLLREQKLTGDDLRIRISLLVSKRLTELTSTANEPEGKKQAKKVSSRRAS